MHKNPRLARLQPNVARHNAVMLPLLMVRRDFVLHKTAHGIAEHIVFVIKNGSFHRFPFG